jgi:hypothetical protein
MAYLEGRSKPFNWMRPADLQRISKSEAVRNNAVEASEKIIVT